MSTSALRVLICCLVFVAFTLPSAPAQVQEPAENRGAAAAYGALLRLRSTATVLHTTAHPDDEDGALLAWLSRQQGVRTGLLTLTRGEGGANLIGPELYDALALCRAAGRGALLRRGPDVYARDRFRLFQTAGRDARTLGQRGCARRRRARDPAVPPRHPHLPLPRHTTRRARPSPDRWVNEHRSVQGRRRPAPLPRTCKKACVRGRSKSSI